MDAKLATERVLGNGNGEAAKLDPVLEQVCAAMKGLQFGAVTVTFQDGYAVQIERHERTRLLPRQRR